MKCAATTSDGKADAVVKVGGTQCDEYGTHLAKDGAICTWIAVTKGQKINIDTGFTGLTKELQFDLVIDGVLRNSAKTNRKEEKKDRRSEKFEHGFYAQSKAIIVEAELEIKDLNPSAYPSIETEGKDSVGTIEVRISVLRDENEERHKLDDVKTFETIMSWKEAYRTPSYTKVRPIQEIDFVPIDQQPQKVQFTKLKQRASGHRPGAKPWVVFRFYYRTQDAINNEALTKATSKQVVKFDPPPIEKTAVESAATTSAQASSTVPGTTATTSKAPSTMAGTSATTAEASTAKVDATATGEATSTKTSTVTTAAEAPGHDKTSNGEAAAVEAPKLPVADPKDAVIQSELSADPANTDLGSAQPDLKSTSISTSSPADNLNSSPTKPVQQLPLHTEQSSTMSTIETQPIVAGLQQGPVANMAKVATKVPAPQAAEKPVITRPKTPEPAPVAKMTLNTPPTTPKPIVEAQALPKATTTATTVFDASPELEFATPEIKEAPKTQLFMEDTIPEPITGVLESIKLKVEAVEPTTPKVTEKRVGGIKRPFSATPTPDPASKRMKLENDSLEKRYAEKKKFLAEKRAVRIKAQEKAQEQALHAEVNFVISLHLIYTN
jgi:hypothetical protein